MPGSIRQRHDRAPNTFDLRVFLGSDREGHVRHHSELYRGTRKQAELALAHLVANWTVFLRQSRALRLSGAPRQLSMTRLRVGRRTAGST